MISIHPASLLFDTVGENWIEASFLKLRAFAIFVAVSSIMRVTHLYRQARTIVHSDWCEIKVVGCGAGDQPGLH